MATRKKLTNSGLAALLTRRAAASVSVPDNLDPELKEVAETVLDGFRNVGLDELSEGSSPDVIDVEGHEVK